MTNKFPIGSQWKTRAGHRAVVVDVDSSAGLVVWHSNTGFVIAHNAQGVGLYDNVVGRIDLLTPWTEPRKGTFFVNVYPDGAGVSDFESKESADDSADTDRIACVRVDWTEGDGL